MFRVVYVRNIKCNNLPCIKFIDLTFNKKNIMILLTAIFRPYLTQCYHLLLF